MENIFRVKSFLFSSSLLFDTSPEQNYLSWKKSFLSGATSGLFTILAQLFAASLSCHLHSLRAKTWKRWQYTFLEYRGEKYDINLNLLVLKIGDIPEHTVRKWNGSESLINDLVDIIVILMSIFLIIFMKWWNLKKKNLLFAISPYNHHIITNT